MQQEGSDKFDTWMTQNNSEDNDCDVEMDIGSDIVGAAVDQYYEQEQQEHQRSLDKIIQVDVEDADPPMLLAEARRVVTDPVLRQLLVLKVTKEFPRYLKGRRQDRRQECSRRSHLAALRRIEDRTYQTEGRRYYRGGILSSFAPAHRERIMYELLEEKAREHDEREREKEREKLEKEREKREKREAEALARAQVRREEERRMEQLFEAHEERNRAYRDRYMERRAFKAMTIQGECMICNETKDLEITRISEWKESYTDPVCAADHRACKDCMANWIKVEVVDNQKLNVTCPDANCNHQLSFSDVKRFASNDTVSRLKEALSTNHKEAAAELLREHPTIRGFSRQCPTCHVLIEKNGGCSTVVCKCGNRFTYESHEGDNPGTHPSA